MTVAELEVCRGGSERSKKRTLTKHLNLFQASPTTNDFFSEDGLR